MCRGTPFLAGMVAIVVIMTNCGAAAAEDRSSAGYLVEGCRAAATDNQDERGDYRLKIYKTGICTGTIQSLHYVSQGISSCAPSGVTLGQMLKVVVAYIDQRPARLHENLIVLVLEALRAAWPCKRR
jgi:hypothetical protein